MYSNLKRRVSMKKIERIWLYQLIIFGILVMLMSDCAKEEDMGDCTISCSCPGNCTESKTYVNVSRSDCDIFIKNRNLPCNCNCTGTFVKN
jgi:hypothetical protein